MITISNLTKVYGDTTVLDIPELTIKRGELIGLVGNNGAGKSTMLRLILDLIKADTGHVELMGQKVNESTDWKYKTGSFVDGSFLIDFLTPEEYFAFIAKAYGISKELMDERLTEYHGLMNGEVLGTKKYIKNFSEGNKQKTGIIGAMFINPDVLLLDEPFNYLDPSSQITVSRLIHKMNKELGCTIIISSHNLNLVSDISSRILLLEKGNIIKDLPNTKGEAITELENYFEGNI